MTTKEKDLENDDVRRLLASMQRVEAPGDFDLRVRARIAQGRPAARRVWFPMPARAAAVMLVMLAAGYFGFRSYQPAGIDQASLAPVQMPDQALAEKKEEPTSRDIPQPASTEESEKSVPKGMPPNAVEPQKRNDNKGGGSLDITSGISQPQGPVTSTDRSLSAIGVAIDPSGAVSEVKQNSVAERSGLKLGDLIVSVTATNFRVKRGGKVIDLPRKN